MNVLHFLILLMSVVSVFCINPEDIGCDDSITPEKFAENDAKCVQCKEQFEETNMLEQCREDCFKGKFFRSCVDHLSGAYDEKDDVEAPPPE
uniref:Alpha-latrotoxin associated low molecular weight protein SGV150-311 n=1 Tax=Steatoda grossa TaxID=256750 RepID=TXAC_STEGR|nr:RecName: Full=Alpha-latrotoxin associated low molecular weight protein SGV150-311; Short=Alpha-latrotoxin-associated LMWP SGV150-311; AltName: Full=Latrodectin; Flags: Precursor [Steatoda grossa]AHC13265.1 alpha-latrotoxin associated low molecular weight protein [Steatoda grossa]